MEFDYDGKRKESFFDPARYYYKAKRIYERAGPTIKKASKYVLGEGVLGMFIPAATLILILNMLYGNDFTEVKNHEMNHYKFPNVSETDIRRMTSRELPFTPRFHEY